MPVLKDFYTMTEVAEKLGVTSSRVRQLCLKHDIGTKIGQYRFLSESDVNDLTIIHSQDGRRKKT